MSTNQQRLSVGEWVGTLIALAAASISPLAFPIAEGGHAGMRWLAIHAMAPAAFALVVVLVVSVARFWQRLASGMLMAIPAGIIATGGLEIVRVIGFRLFDAMPGSMPMLMGVLLTGRSMAEPTWVVGLVGWADHFFNGICFAMVYILVFGRRRWWVAVVYAWVIGTIFMISPVVTALDAGFFGQSYAPLGFPIVVYVAHTVYGTLLGWLVSRSAAARPTLFHYLRQA